MALELKIRRQKSQQGKGYWEHFTSEVSARATVLDALIDVKKTQAPELAFRAGCRSGQCGSDAMYINGRPRLACQTVLSNLTSSERVIIMPLEGFTVLKDLIVDRSELHSLKVKNQDPNPNDDITDEERSQMRSLMTCNLCGACEAACPVNWQRDSYPGPAVLLRIFRELLCNNDDQQILSILSDPRGPFNCETEYNCSEVCPREINVAQLLSQLKSHLTGTKSH